MEKKFLDDVGTAQLVENIKNEISEIPGVSDLEQLQSDVADLQESKQDALSFDNSPVSGSSNPVTSSGIYAALSGKSDTGHQHSAADITSGTLAVARGGTGNTSVDTTPTSGSTKMCTSGGILTALNGKQATLTVTSGTCTANTAYLRLGGTDSIRWAKYGRIAVVTVEVNSGSSTVNLSANSVLVLASGAPATYGGMLANASADTQRTVDGYSYTRGNRFWVDGNGNICFFIPVNAWTGSIHFTATYITAS